jgi:hypothetical protein
MQVQDMRAEYSRGGGFELWYSVLAKVMDVDLEAWTPLSK